MKAATLVEQKSNIFEQSIPNYPTPVLEPTPWRPSNFTRKFKKNIKQKITDFGAWVLNYILPKPKVLESFKNKIKKMDEKKDTLFQPAQSKSALQNFAIQYQIK